MARVGLEGTWSSALICWRKHATIRGLLSAVFFLLIDGALSPQMIVTTSQDYHCFCLTLIVYVDHGLFLWYQVCFSQKEHFLGGGILISQTEERHEKRGAALSKNATAVYQNQEGVCWFDVASSHGNTGTACSCWAKRAFLTLRGRLSSRNPRAMCCSDCSTGMHACLGLANTNDWSDFAT